MEKRDKQKTPKEKKNLSYTKDHIDSAEYPHAFRNFWPKKKARVKREERRKLKQGLRELEVLQEEGEEFLAPARKQVRKYPPRSLGDSVEWRLKRRLERVAWNYFKTPYQAAEHREKFCALLKSLVQGRSPYAEKLALFIEELLDQNQPWLRRFLEDQPEWEGILRRWIGSFQSSKNPK